MFDALRPPDSAAVATLRNRPSSSLPAGVHTMPKKEAKAALPANSSTVASDRRGKVKVVSGRRGTFKLTTCDLIHTVDWGLAAAIAQLWIDREGTEAVNGLELGAGCGCYTDFFLWMGFHMHAVDGTDDISQLTNGMVRMADLTVRQNFPVAAWVLCLEVGEHIPPEHLPTFLGNLVNHASHGIVLSWAVRGQHGKDHVSMRDNDEVVAEMRKLGMLHSEVDSWRLRQSAGRSCCSYFPKSVIMFIKAHYLRNELGCALPVDVATPLGGGRRLRQSHRGVEKRNRGGAAQKAATTRLVQRKSIQEPLPDFVEVGRHIQAKGSYMGTRLWFTAEVIQLRATSPRIYVKYLADSENNTHPRCLPSPKRSGHTSTYAYVAANEVAPPRGPAN